MNVLVTGGTGFIGSHVCLLLLEQGHNVYIIDSLINSNFNVIDRIKVLTEKNLKENLHFYKGDLRQIEDIKNVFKYARDKNESIEIVLHFAGLKSVNESSLKPFLYWENNVIASYNLLKIMEENDCKNIVFSSSATVYGDKYKSPISEDCEVKPLNPYGFTKVTVENLLSNIYSNSCQSWKISILRYFNPVGNHFSGIIGEESRGIPSNLFPYICKVAAGEIDELTIFGNNWDTPDGSGVRDYIHVMDLAEGHISAMNFIKNNKDRFFSILNLGTGYGTSVFEMIEVFEKVNDVRIKYKIGERRLCDSAEVFADCSRSNNILNWKARRSIKEMCRDGWLWQKKKC